MYDDHDDEQPCFDEFSPSYELSEPDVPAGPGPDDISPDALGPGYVPPPYPTVPDLFPRASVNLLIGNTKIGCLRFILPQLDNYVAGLPFLSVASQAPEFPPEQLGIVICGRQKAAVKGKFTSLQLTHLNQPGVCPVVRWNCAITDQHEPEHEFPLEQPYRDLTKLADGRKPHFLFVEGLQLLMLSEKANTQRGVAVFMDQLHKFCDERDCTVLGRVGKSKASEHYADLAHKILGSSQWGVSASTLINFELLNQQSTIRKITIQSSEGYEKKYGRFIYADFDLQDRLLPVPQPDRPERPSEAAFRQMTTNLNDAEPGTRFIRVEFLEWGWRYGIKDRTVGKWIADKLESGELVREGPDRSAEYIKPLPN